MTMLPPAHTALQTLARLNQLVSSSLDMEQVLHDIAHAAAALMDALLVHVLIADEATHTLASRAFSDARLGISFAIIHLCGVFNLMKMPRQSQLQ